VAVVEAERADEVLQASLEREQREAVKRERLQGGALSWHIDGLKEKWT
jgi:regulator of RNase E activity RraA